MRAPLSALRLLAALLFALASAAALAGAQQYEPLAASVRAALHEAVSDAVAPTLPLLIPGVGAQGGDAVATVKAGYRSASGKTTAPIVVNSSRAVLYASQGADFAQAARAAAMATRDQLQAAKP